METYETDISPSRTLSYLETNNPYVLLTHSDNQTRARIIANTHVLPLGSTRDMLRFPEPFSASLTWKQSSTNNYEYKLWIADVATSPSDTEPFLTNISSNITQWRRNYTKTQFKSLTNPELSHQTYSSLTDRLGLLYDFYKRTPDAQTRLPDVTEQTLNDIEAAHGTNTTQEHLKHDMPLLTVICPQCSTTWEHLIPIPNPTIQTILDTLYCPACSFDTIPVEYVQHTPTHPC